MADLITIDDIEAALGREITDDEEIAQVEHYINIVSRYITNSVDVSFEPVTVTQRLKADSYGQIKLIRPVTDIAAVNNFRTGNPDLFVDFDGIDLLYFLAPHQVVDVTYSYGYNSVPDDIIDVATSLVLNLVGEQAPTNLTKYKVGDVEELYGESRVAALIDDYIDEVLDNYRQEWYSVPLATDSFPDYRSPQGYLQDFD